MIHRWHAPHYDLVAVYLWPWLFWQLWQIDRWTAYTGRRVFVEVDRQGRAYSTWWEGMDLYWDEETGESYRPWRMSDLQELLPNSPLWRAAFLGSAHPGQAQRDPGSQATSFVLCDALRTSSTRREAGSVSRLRRSHEPG